MESGKTAVVIIIVAMMLTAGVGFLFNFEKKWDDKTEYNQLGNLNAILSVNSGRSNESEIYNPTTNVTGWYPNTIKDGDTKIGGIEISTSANPYVISPARTLNTDTETTFTVEAYTEHYQEYKTSANLDNPLGITNVSNVALKRDTTELWNIEYDTNNGVVTYLSKYSDAFGGYGQSMTVHYPGYPTYRDYYYSLNYYMDIGNDGTNDFTGTYANGNYINIVSLGKLIPPSTLTKTGDELRFVGTNPTLCVGCTISNTYRSWDSSGVSSQTYHYQMDYTITCQDVVLGTAYDYLLFNGADNTWQLIKNGRVVGSVNPTNLYVYTTDFNDKSWTTTYTTYTYYDAVYADPTQYVKIPANNSIEWSNTILYDNDVATVTTMIDSQVSFLVKGTGQVKLFEKSANGVTGTYPLTLYINSSGTGYIVSANAGTAVQLGTYIGLRITISQLTNSITVQGIVSDESGPGTADTPTYVYQLADIIYTIPLPSGFKIPYIGALKFVATTADFYGYIDQTYILTDPNQALWADINVVIGDYFPENIDNLRVLFQGFVKYGTKIYINEPNPSSQNGYTVTDGKIVVNDTTFNLNGMAVEYRDNEVFLVQTNGREEVSLGEMATTRIIMEGVWYFSSTAYGIHTYKVEEHVWTPGWTMDMNTTILTFVGVIFFSLVVLAMRFRDELELIDVIVLILTMLIALSLLVVS